MAMEEHSAHAAAQVGTNQGAFLMTRGPQTIATEALEAAAMDSAAGANGSLVGTPRAKACDDDGSARDESPPALVPTAHASTPASLLHESGLGSSAMLLRLAQQQATRDTELSGLQAQLRVTRQYVLR